MTDPSTAVVDDRSPGKLDRVQSRERVVRRIFTGYVLVGTGLVGMLVTTPVIESVLGASQFVERVWSLGARSLVPLGFFVAASAGIRHLRRFGGRRGVLAFTSFAAAGASMLVAIAEQIETWFLDTHALQGLDIWGLTAAGVFGVLGGLLLGDKPPERVDAI